MTPQANVVLSHLMSQGSITGVEAEACHRVRHLPARIHELRNAGVRVHASTKRDVNGQRYVRYSI